MQGSKYLFLLLISLIIFTSCSVWADEEKYVIVAPHCLLRSIDTYDTLAKNNRLSLAEINQNNLEKLSEVKSKHISDTPCGGFMNVTDAWKEFNSKHGNIEKKAEKFLAKYTMDTKEIKAAFLAEQTAYSIRYEKQVNQLLAQINSQNMWNNLTKLTSFPDRYSRSQNGVDAANWIKEQVENFVKNTSHDDVEISLIRTGTNYKQPSVVVKIGKSNEPGVVIGGHMDTLSSFYEKKPGADDDGTGSVTVLEVARTIISSNMKFKKPIYLIWYAAEEQGLVGSQYVVDEFKKKNIRVSAVIQFDMTGYVYKNDPTIWLITDYVNKDLTAFLETLINTYVKQPVGRTACGYACSDHATWHNKGFTASMAFEAKYGTDNPYIHSARDTMDLLSLPHMTNFAKLAVAFAVEFAEPIA